MATIDCVLNKEAYRRFAEQYYTKPISAKKKAEFSKILRRAIHNELSEVDAEILNMYFVQGYTKTKIAEYFGVDTSTICRRINKSVDILYEKLKYAAEYRYGIVIAKRC